MNGTETRRAGLLKNNLCPKYEVIEDKTTVLHIKEVIQDICCSGVYVRLDINQVGNLPIALLTICIT